MAGYITKRGNSKHWTVVVSYGRDPFTRKLRQKWWTIAGTKREAEAFLVQRLHERDTGIDLPVERLTVRQYLDGWLAYVEANRAPRTFQTARDIAVRHVSPALGGLPLAKLKPAHIQAYLDRARTAGRLDGKGGLSARSVVRHYQVIHAALQHAVDLELLPRNPASRAKAPQAERREFRALTPAEVRRLLVTADRTPYGALVRLAVLTGLRQGELLGLRWSDVDSDAGLLTIRQSAQWLKGQGVRFKVPKSGKGRMVALAADSVQLLRQHRRQQAEARLLAGPAYADHGLVFQTPLGTPIDPSNLRRAWRGVVTRTDIDHVRFHDLRHTHASLMLRQGTHLKVVSERLGHASIAITADIYSHVAPGLQAAAAAQLEQLLAASGD